MDEYDNRPLRGRDNQDLFKIAIGITVQRLIQMPPAQKRSPCGMVAHNLPFSNRLQGMAKR